MKKSIATLAFAVATGVAVSAGSAMAAGDPALGKMMYFDEGNWAANERAKLSDTSAAKPETTKCTSCHGSSPQQGGQTRAGKPIDPMAVSRTPDRFTDPRKVAKWFRRNCRGVIGRECTQAEKDGFIAFLKTQ